MVALNINAFRLFMRLSQSVLMQIFLIGTAQKRKILYSICLHQTQCGQELLNIGVTETPLLYPQLPVPVDFGLCRIKQVMSLVE